MNWNFDMYEAPTHRNEPVLIAAKDSNRQFVAWYSRHTGRWVGLPPAFEPLAWKSLEPHPRPGKAPTVDEQLVKELTPPEVSLPPGIVLEPKVSLPPGVL